MLLNVQRHPNHLKYSAGTPSLSLSNRINPAGHKFAKVLDRIKFVPRWAIATR